MRTIREWKYNLEWDLRHYNSMIKTRDTLQKRIETLNAEMVSIRPARTDMEPVQGGMSRREDAYLDMISRIDDLKPEYVLLADKIWAIDEGMKQIGAGERKILEMMYIQGYTVEATGAKLSIDRATVYRRANKALRELRLAMHG